MCPCVRPQRSGSHSFMAFLNLFVFMLCKHRIDLFFSVPVRPGSPLCAWMDGCSGRRRGNNMHGIDNNGWGRRFLNRALYSLCSCAHHLCEMKREVSHSCFPRSELEAAHWFCCMGSRSSFYEKLKLACSLRDCLQPPVCFIVPRHFTVLLPRFVECDVILRGCFALWECPEFTGTVPGALQCVFNLPCSEKRVNLLQNTGNPAGLYDIWPVVIPLYLRQLLLLVVDSDLQFSFHEAFHEEIH